MKKTLKKSAVPSTAVVPAVSDSADPLFNLTYSQIVALVEEAHQKSARLDLKAHLAHVMTSVQHLVPTETLSTLPPEFQQAVDRAKEPRRQTKTRVMHARVGYVLQAIKTKQQSLALFKIVPGEAQVISYIGTHHRPGVQEIALGTNLSLKTVKNCTYTLVQKKLIASVKL